MEKTVESRKKGIAITAITALVAYRPETYIELAVCGCVLIIAVYAINRQWNIDNGEKNEENNDNLIGGVSTE
ncbi:hypothetical protein LCGC14_0346410 [marine sediment metagenome]|uniref:Uncharacterized protein n=1 Tax=marine sediment metagenome TaxID=412755 RepID=A0A0F9THZ8_9ZZZZ